jgi:hypothetical protein
MKLRFFFILSFSLTSSILFSQQDPTRGGMFLGGDYGSLSLIDSTDNKRNVDGINFYGLGYQYYMTERSGNTGFGFRIGLHFGDLFSVRLGPTYNLGKGRFQIPFGVLGNIAATSNKKKFGNSGAVYSLEPMIGAQFYFTNRFYIQGEAKYFWGVLFGENETENSYKESIGGYFVNIRLGINFSKRISKL